MVLKDALANYAVVGERIFYVNDGDIYSYDLRTAENIKVIDSNIGPNFVNNDEYIVLDNLEVYSLSGDYVCKLALKSFYQILGMDEEYILARDTGVGSDTEEYVPKLFVKVVSEIDDKPFTEYICED